MGKGTWSSSKIFLCKCLCKDPCSLWAEFFHVHIQFSHYLLIGTANNWVSIPCGRLCAPLSAETEGLTTGTAHKLTPTLPMSLQFPKVSLTPKDSLRISKRFSSPTPSSTHRYDQHHFMQPQRSWGEKSGISQQFGNVCHIFYIKGSSHFHCVKIRYKNNFELKDRFSAENQYVCCLQLPITMTHISCETDVP